MRKLVLLLVLATAGFLVYERIDAPEAEGATPIDVEGKTFTGLISKAKFKLKGEEGFTGTVRHTLFFGPQAGIPAGRFRLLDIDDGLDMTGTYAVLGKKVTFSPDLGELLEFLSIEDFIEDLAAEDGIALTGLVVTMGTPTAFAKFKLRKKTGNLTVKKMKLKAPYTASANVDGTPKTRTGKVTGAGKQKQ